MEGDPGNPFMEALKPGGGSAPKRDKVPNPPKDVPSQDRLPPPDRKLMLRSHREVQTEMVRVYILMAHNHIPTNRGAVMVNSLRAIAGTMAEAVAVRRAEQMMEIERLEARITQLRAFVEDAECRLLGGSQKVLSSTPVSTPSSGD